MVKSKYRSIDEIREAFEQFNIHEESDVQVMKRLVSVLQNKTAHNNLKLLALKDLEYYVHQVITSLYVDRFNYFNITTKIL